MSNLPYIEFIEDKIGHKFKKPRLLLEAITHKSIQDDPKYNNEPHYERLEFLGDRVLGLVMAQILFDKYPNEQEGQISRRFAALVSKETLAEVARKLGIAEHIRFEKITHESKEEVTNPSILADVMEAIMAALFMDSGLSTVHRFIEKNWKSYLDGKSKPPKDPKTALQEWAQKKGMDLPRYRVMEQQGPDHSPLFKVTVDLSGIPVLTGLGTSKKEAERDVAKRVLSFINESNF